MMHQVIIHERLYPSPTRADYCLKELRHSSEISMFGAATRLDNFLHRSGYDSLFWSQPFNVLQQQTVNLVVVSVKAVTVWVCASFKSCKATLSWDTSHEERKTPRTFHFFSSRLSPLFDALKRGTGNSIPTGVGLILTDVPRTM